MQPWGKHVEWLVSVLGMTFEQAGRCTIPQYLMLVQKYGERHGG